MNNSNDKNLHSPHYRKAESSSISKESQLFFFMKPYSKINLALRLYSEAIKRQKGHFLYNKHCVIISNTKQALSICIMAK